MVLVRPEYSLASLKSRKTILFLKFDHCKELAGFFRNCEKHFIVTHFDKSSILSRVVEFEAFCLHLKFCFFSLFARYLQVRGLLQIFDLISFLFSLTSSPSLSGFRPKVCSVMSKLLVMVHPLSM